MKKYFSFWALALMAVFSLSFVSCGGDDDEEEVETNGSLIGTWEFDFWEEDDFSGFYSKGWTQFKSDGTYVDVDVTFYTEDDEYQGVHKGDQEIIIDRGNWKTSGDIIFMTPTYTNSKDPDDQEAIGVTSKLRYSVEGNRLYVSTLDGLIITLGLTRVSDSVIEKYLK